MSQQSLLELATAHGVATSFVDGLKAERQVSTQSLFAILRSLGVSIETTAQAPALLKELHQQDAARLAPPVLLAWDGQIADWAVNAQPGSTVDIELTLEEGTVVNLSALVGPEQTVAVPTMLPLGYHQALISCGAVSASCHVISAPTLSWQTNARGWGVYAHLPAVRTERSRAVGDLRDLRQLCDWVGDRGGDLVSVLPLLPVFVSEPSPYSPVSRLFWNELHLDLGERHQRLVDQNANDQQQLINFETANAEVRNALRHLEWPDEIRSDPELDRYARFRGTQARHGRNWRLWPAELRNGHLTVQDSDPLEEWFHRHAQSLMRSQLQSLTNHLEARGRHLGLDLAVGVHPDGYDVWSRQQLFANGVSVGAPPDAAFPSGQNWGFSPVLPHASAAEGHQYLAASVRHQAAVTGVLRVDHVMAVSRLFWIPDGAAVSEGTYVANDAAEQFAVLALESHRHRCALIGENLGTVPDEVDEGLKRHRIWGSFVAQFSVDTNVLCPPQVTDVAMSDTHDTATFAGWLVGEDILDRVATGLLPDEGAPAEQLARAQAVASMYTYFSVSPTDQDASSQLLEALFAWMAAGPSPWVITAVENLWLEPTAVNLPGTSTSERNNWQRPWSTLLETLEQDPLVQQRMVALTRHTGAAGAEPEQTPRGEFTAGRTLAK